jgi:succinate dehydrogenase/fumarate reductase cytochrome b subunit
MSARATLPRNTTHQAVIVVFVLAHVIAQAVLHAPALAAMKAGAPWLPAVQSQHWVHALLYFSIVFHTLYGLKLLATELGARIDYRAALWLIVAVSALVGLREVLRYAGI